jgi:WD40 repeat protein
MRLHPPCPGPADLQALLRQALSAEENGRLAEHLDTCRTCQQALEALAAGGETLSLAQRRRLRRWPALEGALRRAVEELEADFSRADRRAEARGEDYSLSFLSPSPERASLGRLGAYEVTEVIGRGGMGVVLKAFDPSLRRFVAIKVLAPQLATSVAARRRFAREGRAAAAVSHEHVVTVHGVDEANGLPYLVMEYVTGISLQDRLDATGPLGLEEVLRIGMQAAAGLSAAHAQGLVHRDVKPANILLENGVERVKLTDFGLARAADDASLTQSGVVAGTPQYMAPEQARGEPLDHRADLFSLGSVLYAMCTGRPPFRASSTMAVLRRVSEETPRAVRQVNPQVPAWLSDIIAKLHARAPADRFQSAGEVADLLRRHLAHQQQPLLVPMPPGLPGPRGRVARWLRGRGLALAAAVVLVCLAGFGLARPGGFGGLFGSGPGGAGEVSAARLPLPRLRASLRDPSGPVLGAAFAPGSEVLAIACDDHTVKLWDLSTGQVRAVLGGHTRRVWSVAFAPDGKTIASAAGDWHRAEEPGEVIVWDATKGKRLRSLTGHTGLVFAVAFSGDSRSLASASWDGTARLWDPATGEEKFVLDGHTAPVRSVVFAPDGTTLATGSFDGSVRLWSAATGEERGSLRSEPCTINCVAFSPDGKTLAAAENARTGKGGEWTKTDRGWDERRPGRVRLWDVATRRERSVLAGHQGMILSLGFSPDGGLLATGGGHWDQFGELKLWDAGSGRELVNLNAHGEWVECVCFAPDGRTLASGGGVAGGPGDVRLWNVDRGGPTPHPAPATLFLPPAAAKVLPPAPAGAGGPGPAPRSPVRPTGQAMRKPTPSPAASARLIR